MPVSPNWHIRKSNAAAIKEEGLPLRASAACTTTSAVIRAMDRGAVLTMQGVGPSREDDTLCTRIIHLQVEQMFDKRLDLASIVAKRFDLLYSLENLRILSVAHECHRVLQERDRPTHCVVFRFSVRLRHGCVNLESGGAFIQLLFRNWF